MERPLRLEFEHNEIEITSWLCWLLQQKGSPLIKPAVSRAAGVRACYDEKGDGTVHHTRFLNKQIAVDRSTM